MAKGWFDFILPPPPYIFVKGTFNFCKLPQINGPKFKNAAQTKPPAGSILGSRGRGQGHDLAGSEPEQGQQAVPQADEEAAPAHGPNPKTAGPGAICSGACCHFLWKKIMLSGALRRLLFVLSLCGDHDNAHCYQIVFLIGYLAKRSAHVADVCGLLAAQAQKVVCITLVS